MITKVKFTCAKKTNNTRSNLRTFLYKTQRMPEVRSITIKNKYPTKVILQTPTATKTAYTIHSLAKQYNIRVSHEINTRAASYRFYHKTETQPLLKLYPVYWGVSGLLAKLYTKIRKVCK